MRTDGPCKQRDENPRKEPKLMLEIKKKKKKNTVAEMKNAFDELIRQTQIRKAYLSYAT